MYRYPEVNKGRRYLNSGLFICYAPELYRLLIRQPVSYQNNDQNYFTQLYLDQTFRFELGWKLDHCSEVFQNLGDAVEDIELGFHGEMILQELI